MAGALTLYTDAWFWALLVHCVTASFPTCCQRGSMPVTTAVMPSGGGCKPSSPTPGWLLKERRSWPTQCCACIPPMTRLPCWEANVWVGVKTFGHFVGSIFSVAIVMTVIWLSCIDWLVLWLTRVVSDLCCDYVWPVLWITCVVAVLWLTSVSTYLCCEWLVVCYDWPVMCFDWPWFVWPVLWLTCVVNGMCCD